VAGISFVGSTRVARIVSELGARSGKRVQALGGAKNHVIVMPDARMDPSVEAACASVFGCAGQRCLAGSVVVAVGEAYEGVKAGLLDHAGRIVVGDGADPGTTMGPVISEAARERITAMIQIGVDEGAGLLLDGRGHRVPDREGGYWLGPTILGGVTPDMRIAQEEVFGPVLCLVHARDLDEAIEITNRSTYANAASIFTTSGAAAREFKYRAAPSMLGVNIGVAAPMAFFPFGGAKESFFGTAKAHGPDAIEFFTDQKVVISRWLA
jgi:malonate-semialdehyde dehydrogenase (acetylating)/methylmalonate-semialdehyde dehydrogenase